jgi:hypothetical protein
VTRAFVIGALVLLCAAGARAQTATSGEIGRFEAGVGPVWTGRASFGTRDATETTSTGAAVPVFSTTTSLEAVTGIEARFGIRVTRRLDVEALGSYAGPHLVASVRNDAEAGAGPFTSEEWIQQFAIGGALVWRVATSRAHPRLVPFVTGGAEYVRQRHEQQTLVLVGRLYQAGGGVKYVLGSRERARLKTFGVRLDGRAIVRTAGVNTDGRAHVSPAIAASMFVRF